LGVSLIWDWQKSDGRYKCSAVSWIPSSQSRIPFFFSFYHIDYYRRMSSKGDMLNYILRISGSMWGVVLNDILFLTQETFIWLQSFSLNHVDYIPLSPLHMLRASSCLHSLLVIPHIL
jgi:hypothetical protein